MRADEGANGTERQTEWQAVDWRQANRRVRNLRQRIFRATQRGDWKTVQSLEKLMLRSRSNILVSVRRVTQVNQGKRTPGVDWVVVKTPAARDKLVAELATYQPWRARPARRLYIPKANGTRRPLGIPTVRDRCLQAMVKNALEPSWEADFERSSYGFRPGRSAHDAIERIYRLARPNMRKKWVVDADIKGAFDNISHEHLLEAIGPVPGRELIRQWLKAGYMEEGVFHKTEAGTPQGGVISPLLANIALHGMEEALGVKYNTKGELKCDRAVVRYADDFVVFCESKEDAERVIEILTGWLAERGLTLSQEKTRIVHLTEGFDFLGFNVRQYKVPTTKTGYKLLIKPSKDSVLRIRKKLRTEWLKLNGVSVQAVLSKLNPITRGEANYFRTVVASKTFHMLDNWMFRREVRYVRRTHPNKPWKWQQRQYWGCLNRSRNDNWVFGDRRTENYLLKFSWFNISRHVMVQGSASPDDPSLRWYWEQREWNKTHALSFKTRKLAQSQHNVCRLCGETLTNGEPLHAHHIVPRSKGGTDEDSNRTLVHLYCHQQIHGGKVTPTDSAGELLLL